MIIVGGETIFGILPMQKSCQLCILLLLPYHIHSSFAQVSKAVSNRSNLIVFGECTPTIAFCAFTSDACIDSFFIPPTVLACIVYVDITCVSFFYDTTFKKAKRTYRV